MKFWREGLIVGASLLFFSCRDRATHLEDLKKVDFLEVFYPFGFSKITNPLEIETVGDQVLSEHVFSSHGIKNPKNGFINTTSNIFIDRIKNIITITPKYNLRDSAGHEISVKEICDTIHLQFQSTSHSTLSELIRSITCQKNTIKISMKSIPNNMESLFSLPDFFIYTKKQIPIIDKIKKSSSGPYFVESIKQDSVTLKINPHYPKSLRANDIPKVFIKKNIYPSPKVFFENIKKRKYILSYFIGAFINKTDKSIFNDDTLITNINPSEWILMLGFNNQNLKLAERIYIANLLEQVKKEIRKITSFGESAYSFSPSDRPFGIKKKEYLEITNLNKGKRPGKQFKLGIKKDMIENELFALILNILKGHFGDDIKIITYETGKMYTEPDMYVGVRGISAGDPIHHINFSLKYEFLFKKIMTSKELNAISVLPRVQDFNQRVKELEIRMLKERAFIPIGHFPGIIIHSKDLALDESLAGDWGIRAWTYHVY